MRIKALMVCAALTALGGATMPARAADVRIMVSNYRFCIERPFACDPADVGFAGDPDGKPLVAQYSPVTTASVKPGQTVTFVYADDACDAIHDNNIGAGCEGHEIALTDGTPIGSFAPHAKNAVTFTVPATAKAGDVITYFCPLFGHYQSGMNGALQVV